MAEVITNIKIEVTVFTNKNVYPGSYELDDYDKIGEMLQEVLNFINANTDQNWKLTK